MVRATTTPFPYGPGVPRDTQVTSYFVSDGGEFPEGHVVPFSFPCTREGVFCHTSHFPSVCVRPQTPDCSLFGTSTPTSPFALLLRAFSVAISTPEGSFRSLPVRSISSRVRLECLVQDVCTVHDVNPTTRVRSRCNIDIDIGIGVEIEV